jgi:aminocarboxymuconate-semialdehyde decarboxylase
VAKAQGKEPAATGHMKRPAAKRSTRRPLFVIDFHAHVVVPEVQRFSAGHVVDLSPRSTPAGNPAAVEALRRWNEATRRNMVDLPTRLKLMDQMGVDMQVLSPSLVHQYTYWADPEASLKMERMTNDSIADTVAKAPGRFVGLGGVPLQAPQFAELEMVRCIKELGLRGVVISSHAHPMELSDERLRPFWAQAERLGAVVYVHPAGDTDPRYVKYQRWNSIGQPLEEAMAMSSLFYEGLLDAYPKLKICVAHGGGYLPFYAGRVDHNYRDKPWTRVNMSKSPSEYMRRHFWYDSCVYNSDMLQFLAQKVGASRIVMGSDYPVGDADPVGLVRRTRGLSASDKANILGRTAARFLGL